MPLARFRKDYYAGALMILIGLYAAIEGLSYQIGTLSRMGPGMLPVSLGVLLVLLGAAIALTAQAPAIETRAAPARPEWRGWLCICAGIVSFVVLGRYGGLVPATFAIVFISALGDRENTVRGALVLSLALLAVCIAVFWWGLQLQLPLFQWGG